MALSKHVSVVNESVLKGEGLEEDLRTLKNSWLIHIFTLSRVLNPFADKNHAEMRPWLVALSECYKCFT